MLFIRIDFPGYERDKQLLRRQWARRHQRVVQQRLSGPLAASEVCALFMRAHAHTQICI